jgi:riboflavin biosynthesis pyrimidine reductase
VTAAFTPDPAVFEPVEMPPAWPARPWIYGNVIMSRNGIVTWARVGPQDDPIRAIAGGDFTRPGRRADVRLMRRLRAAADAVSFGAQTLRDQPELIGGVADAGGDLGETLVRYRAGRGQGPVPLQAVYTESGSLDLRVRLFNTPGIAVVVVTTAEGARVLRARGSETHGMRLIVAGETRVDARGLVEAHERLFGDFGVRHLDCEGGAVVLDALHEAGILDELFVTVSDVEIDPAAHVAVKRIAALDDGAGRLVAEGRSPADAGYRFQRWRFAAR